MKIKNTDYYQNKRLDEILSELDVDPEQGLADDEVRKRRQKFGPNEVVAREETVLQRILRRFWGPIAWMIEIAALLSAFMQRWEDFFIITVMLLVNVLLDFFQEHRALNALKVLKQQLHLEVRVLRNGQFGLFPARELVPGDIIRVRMGDVIPADVKLLDGDFLAIDESALTGESLPVIRRKGELAYSNTIIKQGEMLALVVNTAANTRFNAVVALVASSSLQERSHFQKMVVKIGSFLIYITLVVVTLIIIAGIIRHESLLEIARFSLVLTVAAIPVALPAVLSVTLAVGAMNLARKKAIVSRLTAIEELAGVDIFCSDKTGTLTKNDMQVTEFITFGDFSERELFLYAVLASRHENHDPIELPLFHYLDSHFQDSAWQQWQQMEFQPFDPVSKYTRATVAWQDETRTVYKGAPQVILERCALSDNEITAINQSIDLFASKGYRTLGVAMAAGDGALQLVGLVALIDPEREDSAAVIKSMSAHGVRVKMITGDNVAIAREIGHRLELGENVVRYKEISDQSGDELLAFAEALSQAIYRRLYPDVSVQQAKHFSDGVIDEMGKIFDTQKLKGAFVKTHESALLEIIESVDIFAEVLPEDKYQIIDCLQKSGHLVGMTGDGVNDAPALKKADCGFAVSNATDAARAAADIILTSPGLSVINQAIEQARITFERMKSYATFRVAETIRIILFMASSILIFNFYPITTVMIILLALLNDIPILAIAYDNTRVNSQPAQWQMNRLLVVSSVLGVAGVVSSFVLFFYLQEQQVDENLIQSLLFLKLIVAGHSTLYITRVEKWFWQKPWPSPILFTATFGTEIVGTLIAVYGVFITPIGWEAALYIWGYALVWLFLDNLVKVFAHKIMHKNSTA